LDLVSHVGSSALGYNHPKLLRVAAQLQTIDPDRYAGCDFIGAWGEDPEKSVIPLPSHLHFKLMEITSQFGFDAAFFSNSGAEAVENAIRFAMIIKKTTGTEFAFMALFTAEPSAPSPSTAVKKIPARLVSADPEYRRFSILYLPGPPCNCGWMVCCTGKKGVRSRLDHYLDPDIGCSIPKKWPLSSLNLFRGKGATMCQPGFHE